MVPSSHAVRMERCSHRSARKCSSPTDLLGWPGRQMMQMRIPLHHLHRDTCLLGRVPPANTLPISSLACLCWLKSRYMLSRYMSVKRHNLYWYSTCTHPIMPCHHLAPPPHRSAEYSSVMTDLSSAMTTLASASETQVWIGLSTGTTSSVFAWIEGDTAVAQYANWDPLMTERASRGCGTIRLNDGNYWGQADCYETHAYLCKSASRPPPAPNDPPPPGWYTRDVDTG
jgi:hypothetical protein